MKIQTKTALLFTALTATIILSTSLTVYYFTSRFAFNDFLKRLELRAHIATRIIFEQNKTTTDAFNELRQQYLEVLPQEKEYILKYDSVDQNTLRQQGLPLDLAFVREVADKKGEVAFAHVKNVHYAGILYNDEKDGPYLVIKSAVNMHGEDLLRNLRNTKAIIAIISVIVVFTISVFFSRKTFEPVRNIISRVNRIGADNMHLRLEEKDGKDEIAELAHTFNNMLDRLQASMETQNNFVSNASHELRTPLTAIIGESDIALSKARTEEEYRNSLEIISREAGKLHRLTTSLLNLARSGFDGKKQNWEILRMDELAFTVKESIDEIDPQNQLQLDLSGLPSDENRISVHGNLNLLKLALTNVAMNACKYSNNRVVKMGVEAMGNKVQVVIVDKGIGIPADELKHIYVPFFRASNTNNYEGYGVGLPLTQAIIRLHNGSINVHSEVDKGTIVTLSLPAAELVQSTEA
ncbi:MAG TPA: HAMP domain-containing sensor histidine kinase [Pseudobacter sp.]|nr:HAMP domain-containing sensor histidine kinase [Pseudobacter sp.]